MWAKGFLASPETGGPKVALRRPSQRTLPEDPSQTGGLQGAFPEDPLRQGSPRKALPDRVSQEGPPGGPSTMEIPPSVQHEFLLDPVVDPLAMT